ncbi:MAG: lauroyl acyltransferase [Micavibrio aeruginosavorus]|uniref:Lauroyl acyltransferase n=1 Tax=Micavibrio aeruginosavorus TaxID=349221 RepID=A0A2W5MYL7_9BACT|nr:MAG: lauroyl acyltransferase [Micavibrio aeruginosavorus]
MKDFRYRMEAAALWAALVIFKCLGAERASALGGFIGRTIGPRMASTRKARANLEKSFPEKTSAEIDHVLAGMWDNLGRVIAEYPHLKEIIETRIDIAGDENLDRIGRTSSYLIMSGHNANWELGSFFFNYRALSPMAGIFRAPNNRYVADLLDQCRNPEDKGNYIPKSSQGARDMMRVMMNKGRLGILIDQKYNQGIPVEFFGRPAMTSVALAQLALKFDRPIVPLQVERLEGCRFRITVHQEIYPNGRDEADIMLECNRLLESWVRQHPGQWLWLHRRWGKDK